MNHCAAWECYCRSNYYCGKDKFERRKSKSKNLEINSSTKTKYEISHRNFSTNMANCYNSDDYATNSSIKFNFTKFGSDYTMKDLTFSNVGNNDMIINLIDYDENKLSM